MQIRKIAGDAWLIAQWLIASACHYTCCAARLAVFRPASRASSAR